MKNQNCLSVLFLNIVIVSSSICINEELTFRTMSDLSSMFYLDATNASNSIETRINDYLGDCAFVSLTHVENEKYCRKACNRVYCLAYTLSTGGACELCTSEVESNESVPELEEVFFVSQPLEDFLDADYLVYYCEGRNVSFRDTTANVSSALCAVESVTVYGDSVWMLYSGANCTGKRYMAKEGHWSQFFGFTGEIAMSLEKIGERCSNRPIGVQNPHIIPNSAFSSPNAYGGTPEEARLYMTPGMAFGLDPSVMRSGGFNTMWPLAEPEQAARITVDLGRLYRVYGMATQSATYAADGLLVATYYMHKFYLLYSAYNSHSLSYYTDNANAKVFVKELDTYYGEIHHYDLASSIIARYVALQGINDKGNYSGVRMEFYGCAIGDDKHVEYTQFDDVDCEDGDLDTTETFTELTQAKDYCNTLEDCTRIKASPYSPDAYTYVLKGPNCVVVTTPGHTMYMKGSNYGNMLIPNGFVGDLLILDDGDMDGPSLQVHAAAAILRLPTPIWLASETVRIKLFLTDPNTCGFSITCFVHANNHVTDNVGILASCQPEIAQYEQGPNNIDVYSESFICTCSYGACEYVYARFEYTDGDDGCLKIYEAEFETYSTVAHNSRLVSPIESK